MFISRFRLQWRDSQQLQLFSFDLRCVLFDFDRRLLGGDDMTAKREEAQGAGIITAVGICLLADVVLFAVYKAIMVVAA